MTLSQSSRVVLDSDENRQPATTSIRNATKVFPSASAKYLFDKVPIVQWLPRYHLGWMLNDVVAGITIGVLLIPQALAYAKIATIPGEFGLLSSWLPPAIYAIMGTSKDLSSGPTSIIGLMTAGIIAEFVCERLPPEVITGVVTFMVGVYSLIFGLFRLSFILDFISLPVLSGFVSAAAITIIIGQVPALFGITSRSGTSNTVYDIITKLPETRPFTFAIGVSGIFLLVAFQQVAKRWGARFPALRVLSITRNAVVLIIFTTFSYFVNRKLQKPIFDISNISSTRIKPPILPSLSLAQNISSRCITLFIAVAIEHLAIAKAFGRRSGYVIDECQELCFLGVSNFLNSFFTTMPTGGAFSRTSVNAESDVKSPLSGLVTSGFVVLGMYFLTPALFWIPKAILSAIIISAVWHIVIPPSTFYKYWRTSFSDFVGSMISFWATLFISVEIGIASAVAFSVLSLLLRFSFSYISQTSSSVAEHHRTEDADHPSALIPPDTIIFKPNHSILFPNASRIKKALLTTIKTHTTGIVLTPLLSTDRLWNDSSQDIAHLTKLRHEAGLTKEPPPLRILVLDLENVTWIDITGIQALVDAKMDIQAFASDEVRVRFVGMNQSVRRKFYGFGWRLVDWSASVGEAEVEKGLDMVFVTVQSAVSSEREDINTKKILDILPAFRDEE